MKPGLRKFPYPYRAALAISSDLDNTPNLETYLALMDYLNGTGDTPLGAGLGLEVGNSFWFFNGTGENQLAYFDAAGKPTPFAEVCRKFWLSGHIDTLHTYGNFDAGGFARSHAERAVAELDAHQARIPVWVNHGTEQNRQNIGHRESFAGATPADPAYHLDLTRQAGVRYFWTGRLTHVLGQDARRNLTLVGKRILQEGVRLVKYTFSREPLFDRRNRLLIPLTLEDGAKVWEFQRWISSWGEVTATDVNDLAVQLSTRRLEGLVRNGGYLVLYTHMGEHLDLAAGLPAELVTQLHVLQGLQRDGHLLVATTGRLLRYREVNGELSWQITTDGDRAVIEIAPQLDTPIGSNRLAEHDLQGLTFYIGRAKVAQVRFDGRAIACNLNPADEEGRVSVSIPWLPLEYPRG